MKKNDSTPVTAVRQDFYEYKPLGARITFTRPVTIDRTDFVDFSYQSADRDWNIESINLPAKKKSRKKKKVEVAEWPTERKRRIVLE